MQQSLNSVKKVLTLLSEPAFLAKDGKIQWLNTAAQSLGLCVQDAIDKLLPEEVSLPQGEDSLHCSSEFLGACWEITLQNTEEHILGFMRKESPAESGGTLLLSAAQSIRPAVEEIVNAGAWLFPQIEELENEELQHKASCISHGCFRLMRTLAELGSYERLHRSTPLLHREKCDLKALFGGFCQSAADVLLDAGIRLEYRLPGTAVYGTVDKQEVQRAFLHLISNAAAHTEEGGEILVKVSKLERKLLLCVENPASVEEGVLPSAFSRYLFPGEGDVAAGAGLGLSVVQAVARHHGGTVMLESREGKTLVSMTLDLSCTETQLQAPRMDYCGGYNPTLVELSPVLPADTFDSRSVDL